eukprot:scaffold8903_cov106-Cylindrotheca_fusiformis.AAC.1
MVWALQTASSMCCLKDSRLESYPPPKLEFILVPRNSLCGVHKADDRFDQSACSPGQYQDA